MAVRQPASFEWDRVKAAANAKKHGVTFDEAATVFDDALAVLYPDVTPGVGEARFVLVGESESGRLLVVVHTDRGAIRIISARLATKQDRRNHERS